MKEKKKVSGKQIKLVINLISLAIFGFSYLYVYSDYVDKTQAAQDEIELVKKSMDDRNKKLAEEETVSKNLEEKNAQIQELIDSYPVYIAKEDNLMFIEKMEEALHIKFTSTNIAESSLFYETNIPALKEDGTEITPVEADSNNNMESANSTNTANTQTNKATDIEKMKGMQATISLNFTTTYRGFKDLVEYIKNYPENTVIDSATVSYDSTTGNLAGSIVIKRYSLTGSGKVYEPPHIDDISIGTDNIFGTNPPPKESIEPPTGEQTETPVQN